MQASLDLRARYCAPPPFANRQPVRQTAAQRTGVLYEEKALKMLEQWAGKHRYHFKAKPWIEYEDCVGRPHYCQPDCLLLSLDTDNLLVVEIKLRHTRDAFKQLHTYTEMVQVLHPQFTISPLELCRYFDKSEFNTTLLPEIRPHNLPHAAVMWDPLPCLQEQLN